MAAGARIGHFNLIRSVEQVTLEEGASIGTFNWITDNLARYTGPVSREAGRRRSALTLGRSAAITSRHYFDCSDEVRIGDQTIAGGIRAIWQTHFLDIEALEQTCRPIQVGSSCFTSTRCLLLGGAVLPDGSVLAAGSVLMDDAADPYSLYAGSPAVRKKSFDPGLPFFNRSRRPPDR